MPARPTCKNGVFSWPQSSAPPCLSKSRCCWRLCETSPCCRACGRCGTQKHRGNCAFAALVVSVLSLVMLLAAAAAGGSSFGALKNTRWSTVSATNASAVQPGSIREVKAYIGLTHVAVQADVVGSGWTETVVGWGDVACPFADTVCDECKGGATGSLVVLIMAIVTQLPQIATDIGRSDASTDLNCQKAFGIATGVFGLISTLASLAAYAGACHNNDANGALLGLTVDWNVGPGFGLIAFATILKVFDVVFHLYLATPAMRQARDLEGFPGGSGSGSGSGATSAAPTSSNSPPPAAMAKGGHVQEGHDAHV